MRVMIVGSGGREHAIAWKLSDSRLINGLYAAPGNAGTAAYCINLPIAATDIDAIVDAAFAHEIDLVVPGPEVPLALGLADALDARSLATGRRVYCFGPSRQAAQIESSKAFAKTLMARYGVPTARFEVCTAFDHALACYEALGPRAVIKASGLAPAGKGVYLPETRDEAECILRSLLIEGSLGEAGRQVVIEQRMSGEEVSLMTFCDGTTLRPMPLAQDHKRLYDDDTGPNTGGMGAYAPLPQFEPEFTQQLLESTIAPVVKGMEEEGCPFSGVLFAGIMLTEEGPRVLEYNCRFGDPETQAILPLFDGDLAPVLMACAQGRLHEIHPVWKPGYAACVVLASQGYPDAPVGGQPILGLEGGMAGTFVFLAGTEMAGKAILSQPGRVLGVAGRGESLQLAVYAAYTRLSRIRLPGSHFRTDIGRRGLDTLAEREQASRSSLHGDGHAAGVPGGLVSSSRIESDSPAALPVPVAAAATTPPTQESMHAGSCSDEAASGTGVFPASGTKTVPAPEPVTLFPNEALATDDAARMAGLIGAALRSTHSPAVLPGIGASGGIFDLRAISSLREPVLVTSSDAIGSKVSLAIASKSYAGIGTDIVNYCIDDILAQGAKPLFFLDHIACTKVDRSIVLQIVTGMADACRVAGCVLLGGGSTEMPGVYREGEYHVTGTIVGLAERASLLPRPDIEAGDCLIGFRSNGLHTNGYSLVRRIFEGVSLDTAYPEIDPSMSRSLKDILLAPHRSYLALLGDLLARKGQLIKGLAHIAAGGFVVSLPRILPAGLDALVERTSWPEPPLFGLIRRLGKIERDRMYGIFNMGIGMVAVVARERVDEFLSAVVEPCWVIGRLVPSQGPRPALRLR